MKTLKIFSAVVLAAGLILPVSGVSAGEITVMSWGGAYTKSQVEAYHKPWMAKTGNKWAAHPTPIPQLAQFVPERSSLEGSILPVRHKRRHQFTRWALGASAPRTS